MLPKLSRPTSVAALNAHLADCGTLLWNGPLGAFEIDPFLQNATEVIYENDDAFYLPTRGFRGVRAPGPLIRIYAVENQPARSPTEPVE